MCPSLVIVALIPGVLCNNLSSGLITTSSLANQRIGQQSPLWLPSWTITWPCPLRSSTMYRLLVQANLQIKQRDRFVAHDDVNWPSTTLVRLKGLAENLVHRSQWQCEWVSATPTIKVGRIASVSGTWRNLGACPISESISIEPFSVLIAVFTTSIILHHGQRFEICSCLRSQVQK